MIMENKKEHYYFSCEADGESVTLSFDIDEGPTIYKFHRMCKKFAAACGYMDESIEDAFGESVYTED